MAQVIRVVKNDCGCGGSQLQGLPKRSDKTLWVVGIITLAIVSAGLLDMAKKRR